MIQKLMKVRISPATTTIVLILVCTLIVWIGFKTVLKEGDHVGAIGRDGKPMSNAELDRLVSGMSHGKAHIDLKTGEEYRTK